MSETPKQFEDDQAAIEYGLLWGDITDTFRKHAGHLGVRITLDEESTFPKYGDKIVLQSEPKDNLMTLLWGHSTPDLLVGKVTLSFQNPETCVEEFMYELTPRKMTYYGKPGKITTFDRDEIADMRADLQKTAWDPAASLDAGVNAGFFDC